MIRDHTNTVEYDVAITTCIFTACDGHIHSISARMPQKLTLGGGFAAWRRSQMDRAVPNHHFGTCVCFSNRRKCRRRPARPNKQAPTTRSRLTRNVVATVHAYAAHKPSGDPNASRARVFLSHARESMHAQPCTQSPRAARVGAVL